jgi:tetratricopeptide (TPR) repeat protein
MACAVLLGVALVKAGEPGRIRMLNTWRRAALLAAAGVLGMTAVVVHGGNNAIVAARDALDRGDAVEAKRQAERAKRFAPWSAEPWRLIGEAEAAAGDLAPARAHIRRAIREDPDAWDSWLALAFATDGRERERAVSTARSLNPLAPELDVLEEADP